MTISPAARRRYGRRVATDPAPPVWLLDIDGVVNVLARGGPPDCWPADAWLQRTVRADVPDRGEMTLPILAARPVLDFVARVHASGAAEIRWHSTWRAAAVTALAPALGLPAVPISVAPEWAQTAAMWWKIPAARRVAESGRRLVWTDDQLTLYRGDVLSEPDLTALDRWAGALLLATDARVGLTPDDLRRIEEFLNLEVVP
jgi:hypothetical protein